MTLKVRCLLFFLLCLSSCKSEKEAPELPLFFESRSVVQNLGEGCEQPKNDCPGISIFYPKAAGPEEISEKINKAVEEHIITLISSEESPGISSLKELTDRFIADYENTARDFPQEPSWEAYIFGRIYYKGEHLISIGMNSEIFMGGAHGYRGLTFINLDPGTGEKYSHEELFTPGFKDLVEKKFREEQEIPPDAEINSTGFWFENEEFHLPANIGFEQNKVLLIYNAYEIAAYSAGDIYMEIPKEEVESHLKVNTFAEILPE